jgi:hypothetical protein
VFVRARRSATIRTRLDRETIRERLSPFARGEDRAPGFWIEKGRFTGGTVEESAFQLDFLFDRSRNGQTYAVKGRVQDDLDWRVIRVKLTARDPWLSKVELFFIALFTGLHYVAGDVPRRGALAVLLFVMGLYAFINLFWVPALVTGRVSGEIASAVNGSVLTGDQWVVPG